MSTKVSFVAHSCYSTLNHSLDLAQHSRTLCNFKHTFLSTIELQRYHCDVSLSCTTKLDQSQKNKLKNTLASEGL